jgi:hypothetical protein
MSSRVVVLSILSERSWHVYYLSRFSMYAQKLHYWSESSRLAERGCYCGVAVENCLLFHGGLSRDRATRNDAN